MTPQLDSPSAHRTDWLGRDLPPDPRALAAGGQPGVERALAILREEFEIALTLLGVPSAAKLTRAHLAR